MKLDNDNFVNAVHDSFMKFYRNIRRRAESKNIVTCLYIFWSYFLKLDSVNYVSAL